MATSAAAARSRAKKPMKKAAPLSGVVTEFEKNVSAAFKAAARDVESMAKAFSRDAAHASRTLAKSVSARFKSARQSASKPRG